MRSVGQRTQQVFLRLVSSQAAAGGGGENVRTLPVPPLSQTLEKFLTTLKPLLPSDQYQRACELAEKFGRRGGYGEQLQQLLENRAKKTVNWLEEWWVNVAYLEFRTPVPVHVNPGILPPRLTFRGKDEQLRYAANLISRVLYKKLIDEGTVPVERLGGHELCMYQYYRILGCCRVPGATRDSVSFNPGGRPDSPRHITVIHNGHIFSMDVYSADSDQPLSSEELYKQLMQVVDQSQTPAVPLGILTTDHRDNWFKAYALLSQDATNERHLTDIQRSIFSLSLDQAAPVTNAATAETVHLNQANHGGGSRSNSGNRWFDKILQVIVSPEGFIGFNYEHSAAEGPPIVQLIDYCWANVNGKIATSVHHDYKRLKPRRLDFNISTDVRTAVDNASKSFDALVDDLDLMVYTFDKFGKEFIKSRKLSPDAFVQVAFQLAYYRMYGHNVATYESGSLRKFRHGRTETIRSCSQASDAYCKAMSRTDLPMSQKASFLRAAVDSHRSYADQVVEGKGIDRHLLGLKLIAIENGMPVPDLLKDPVYEKSCYWQISTSQVPSKVGGLLSFGPVVPDGYGVCYNPMDEQLVFSISTWRSCRETDTARFAKTLEQSLLDGQLALIHEHQSAKL